MQECNKFDIGLHNSQFFISFKSRILKTIRPKTNTAFGAHNPAGLKILKRLQMPLNHLR